MQSRNDATISGQTFTSALRRILPRIRPGAALSVIVGPAGADMLRLSCGPSSEDLDRLAGRWCDEAEVSAAALKAIALTGAPPIVRLVLFEGTLAMNGTTLTLVRPIADAPVILRPPLWDLPLFAYRRPTRRTPP